jgi:hypothetical protein
MVRVIVVPHCTQPWVTSSRSLDVAPLASSAGSIAVITILCAQSGQGSSRDGRREGLTSWQRMSISRSQPGNHFVSDL